MSVKAEELAQADKIARSNQNSDGNNDPENDSARRNNDAGQIKVVDQNDQEKDKSLFDIDEENN